MAAPRIPANDRQTGDSETGETAARLRAAEARCWESGLRLTGPRRALLRLLAEAGDHPDAMRLMQRALAEGRRISLATIYRGLHQLERIGAVRRHDFGHDAKMHWRARWELLGAPRHDHLIDMQSHQVIEFRDAALHARLARIAAALGYRLIDCRLELYALPQPADAAAASIPPTMLDIHP